ncbi:MAG: zinc ribbon domain-containing protein [Treponema sp.]|nr:zinc ribbon domain-containing protein [Treponema sp.]
MKKKSKEQQKTKEAKFFCESCGSEVPRNSRVCPTCGKFFASVRCPKCGKMGTNSDFKNGCPKCGYAINPDSSGGSHQNSIPGVAATNGRFSNGKTKTRGALGFFFGRKKSSSNNGYNEQSLPFWIYAVSIIVLAVLIVCLYSCL